MPDPASSSGESAPVSSAASAPPPQPRRWRRWFKRLAVVMGGGLIVAAGGLGGAEYYTSRPQFCGTCHVMEPYYLSWSHDLHGKKYGVRCIDCHYAPGERETVRAKFRGLSQVASYFSGRYGTSRPRAQVSDASCMQSSCHGDRHFESKMLLIGQERIEKRHVGDTEIEVQRTPTVHFYHEKHLQIDGKLKETIQQRDDAVSQLASVLPAEAVERLKRAALAVSTASDRARTFAKLATELKMNDSARAAANVLGDAEHRITRLRQLEGISCSGCHNFNPNGDSHIAVDRAACYTCHFTGETFNRGTGECLKCHESPTRSILIHATPSTDPAQPVLMNHQDVVRRGVDCASCHFDVIRGDSRVTDNSCTHCHDQVQFMEEFARRTLETVRKYHAVHVAGKRAHCSDCHHVIEHNLADPERLTAGTGFLEPIRNDCSHCHPNHHSEQVELLTGMGGNLPNQPTPNSMLGSRLNCRGCHTQSGTDSKGDQLVRASKQSCLACHSNDYAELFVQWKSELDNYLQEVEEQQKKLADQMTVLDRTAIPPKVIELVEAARENIHLVRAGDGIHNRNFSLQLLDSARSNLEQAKKLLK